MIDNTKLFVPDCGIIYVSTAVPPSVRMRADSVAFLNALHDELAGPTYRLPHLGPRCKRGRGIECDCLEVCRTRGHRIICKKFDRRGDVSGRRKSIKNKT
jgi:hypothetical protein